MITLDVLWAAALGYLLGSIPIAWIVVKLWLKIDIRTVGSKNVGGRNVIRAFQHMEKPKGLAYTVGIIEAILDMLKGFFAMWLALYISTFTGDGVKALLNVPETEIMDDYINKLSLKDLGITYEDLILFFLSKGLLPKNYLSIKTN